MIENLKKAWQGEGVDFQPLTVPRRKKKREHVGMVVKAGLVVIMVLVAFRAGIDLSPPFRDWWRFRTLQRQLLGADDSVRADAAAELAVLNEQAIPVLLSASHDSRPEVREAALAALLKSPFSDDAMVGAMIEAMADTDPRIRLLAIQTLGHYSRKTLRLDSKKADKILDSLIVKFREALKDTDPLVRAEAANALGGLKDRATDSLVDLTPLLKDLDTSVREAAARAIMAIDPARNDAAIAVLIASLAESSPQLNDWPALEALLKMGPDVAAAAVPTLINLLENEEQSTYLTQLHIIRALKEIGPGASEALPALKAFLAGGKWHEKDIMLRRRQAPFPIQDDQAACLHYEAAAAAIAIEGRANPWVISVLIRIVTDEAEPYRIRSVAAKELRKADPDALASYIPKMIERLVSETNPQVRMQGFQLLQEIDPKAIAKGLRSDPLPPDR